MSICNRRHAPRTGPPGIRRSPPGAALRAADMRDASSGWQTSHQRRSWRPSSGPDHSRPTLDGGCACALAFSTLLSSQGADAHHPRPLGLIRGNPANLPVLPDVVKRLREACLRAYPRRANPVTGFSLAGRVLLRPWGPPPAGGSRPPGQDERLAVKRIKSNHVPGVARWTSRPPALARPAPGGWRPGREVTLIAAGHGPAYPGAGGPAADGGADVACYCQRP